MASDSVRASRPATLACSGHGDETPDPTPRNRAAQRTDALAHLVDGTLTADQAAIILRLSDRQVRRLAAACRSGGPDALRHGNAGRVPVNRTEPALRARLAERKGIVVAERTLRRLLSEAGLPAARRHRPARHRARRAHAPGGHAPADRRLAPSVVRPGGWHATLVGAIDDATDTVTGATFRAAEDAAGYLTVLTQTGAACGLPWTLYSDRHGIFRCDPA